MHILKLAVALLAAILMFAVQAVVPTDVINAQDEAKPEAKADWDDGSNEAKFIRQMQGTESLVESDMTQADIDLFCKHSAGLHKVLRANKPENSEDFTAMEVIKMVGEAEWFKAWCKENEIESPERVMPTMMKISLHMAGRGMLKQVERKLTKAAEALKNAAGIKDAMPKVYAKAEAEVAVLKAQVKAINALPTLSKEDAKLVADNNKKIMTTMKREPTVEEKALAKVKGGNATDQSKMMMDAMREASYIVTMHDDPIAGQYWVTASDSYGMNSFTRWQVVKVDGGKAIVENATCMVSEHTIQHYVIAYEVNLAAKKGEVNVTKAWKGLPGEKGTEIDVMAKPEAGNAGGAGAAPKVETEDFTGLELAGGTWSGTSTSSDSFKIWMADNGYFNGMVKMTSGGYSSELVSWGDDCADLLKWK